ncbi:MAG: hypothetical protein M4579_006463 [Chaenotheca gracillima]|nr:MAG: hypothetical protein M4579_006463 [Chaenotheca gracillima]
MGNLVPENTFMDLDCLNYIARVTGRSCTRKSYGVNLDNSGEKADPSIEEAGTSLFLYMLEHLGPRSKDILQTKDIVGRLPLHYGAVYGLTTICQAILKTLQDQREGDVDVGKIILAADDEGLTPLHWSVIYGHTDLIRCFLTALDTFSQTLGDVQGQSLSATLSELFLVALKSQNDDMVHLLASSHINISHQSSSGETPLYVAARMGREDYVTSILKIASEQKVNIDIPETACGWTPLFIACVEGHLPVVELLLRAGSNETSSDYLGWTAKEHAAFRGHLPTADLLQNGTTSELTGGPAQTPGNTIMNPKYRLKPGCTHIVVNLGVMQAEKQIKPIDLKGLLPEMRSAKTDTTLTLEISTLSTRNSAHLVRLPLLDDQVDNALVFPIEHSSEARLVFRLLRKSSISGNRGTPVGSGTALLQNDLNCFGAQRESLVREHSVPILEKETMDFLGTVTFTFVIARPFPHLNNSTSSVEFLEKSDSVQLVGHRGLGQNLAGHEHLQVGENTIESFLSAANLGASHVERTQSRSTSYDTYSIFLDVQMTRDLIPVLFHDFSLSESGTDVPLHDLTLNQFMYANKIQSPQGNPISVLGNVEQRTDRPVPHKVKTRSRSLTQTQEKGAREIRDRLKHTVDFTSKGFKPNTRGDFIQGVFATLEEALREVPDTIGFDIEIKYPRIHEARDAGVAPVVIDLNTFIDTILTLILRFAGKRNIILSSFTPEVCILLSLKQKAYPVLFITNIGKRPVSDRELRAGSLQVAVRFATQWGLAGVVFASDALVMCPRLVGYVKRKGLVCGSYGSFNNEPESVELQVKAGVDVIIADRVGLISKTLKGLSV